MPGNRISEADRGSVAGQTAASQAALQEFVNRPEDGTEVLTRNTEKAIRQKAQEAIEARWLEIGGPLSELGLPIDADLATEKSGSDYRARFRGGDIIFSPDGRTTEEIRKRVRVVLSGFALEQRQESGGDRIYGALMAICPASGRSFGQAIPIYTLGPEADNRVAPLDVMLYEGPPCSLQVTVQLLEQDSGDNAEVRRAIRQRTEATLKAMQDIAFTVAGASAPQVAAMGLDAENGSISAMRGLVADLYGEIIHLALGAGDDQYNQFSVTIGADTMMNLPPIHAYTCARDQRQLTYSEGFNPFTYGRDDGGDRGMIRLLLRIEDAG